MTHNQAACDLASRGFSYLRSAYDGEKIREYWGFCDGRPEVLLDHSATMTQIAKDTWAVSDFTIASAA